MIDCDHERLANQQESILRILRALREFLAIVSVQFGFLIKFGPLSGPLVDAALERVAFELPQFVVNGERMPRDKRSATV